MQAPAVAYSVMGVGNMANGHTLGQTFELPFLNSEIPNPTLEKRPFRLL